MAQTVQWALIGDLPYSEAGVTRAIRLFEQLNQLPLDFVLHVGDIQGSDTPCSDALLAQRARLFAQCHHPLLLLPGDNEWTDCHRRRAGGLAPRERLQALRRYFWAHPDPLGRGGRALALRRQADFPENIQWQLGHLHAVAVHVVGSQNGLDQYPGSRPEFAQRQRANTAWLMQALEHALESDAHALLVAFHANPDFAAPFPAAGYAEHLQALQTVAERFTRPILLAHGDTHRFRIDHPLRDRRGRRFAHVTRVECFGHPFDQAWVHIQYAPDSAHGFLIAARGVG